jgi:hypothetical protein
MSLLDRQKNGVKKDDLGGAVFKGKELRTTIEIDDVEYGHGVFTFHRPTLQERLQVGLRCSDRLRNVDQKTVDEITRATAYMCAMIEVCCDVAPDWFEIDDLYALEVVTEVYNRFVEWLNSFRRVGEEKSQGDSGPAVK